MTGRLGCKYKKPIHKLKGLNKYSVIYLLSSLIFGISLRVCVNFLGPPKNYLKRSHQVSHLDVVKGHARLGSPLPVKAGELRRDVVLLLVWHVAGCGLGGRGGRRLMGEDFLFADVVATKADPT